MTEIELEFESRFIPKMINALKIRTWRRTKHGSAGDVFHVENNGKIYEFVILSVEPITREEFIEQYWCTDGFSSEANAREYFDRHYVTQGGNPVDHSNATGFMHEFRRVKR